AAGVAGAIVQDAIAHGVGDARLKLLEAGILAPDPLSGGEPDAAGAFLHRRDQLREECGVVLPVAIERGDDRAACGAHAAAHGGRLACGCSMPDLAKLGVALLQLSELVAG